MQNFDCRPGCAACCIAISISSAIPGHPNGKAAGIICSNLDLNSYLCKIWNTPEYPTVCKNFKAESQMCGNSRQEALVNLKTLEEATRPLSPVSETVDCKK